MKYCQPCRELKVDKSAGKLDCPYIHYLLFLSELCTGLLIMDIVRMKENFSRCKDYWVHAKAIKRVTITKNVKPSLIILP